MAVVRQGRRLPPCRFDQDERGSFMVLEAILVALLVLTAILFFTSVQRPSTGADQGGLDLGQVSADTLSILQVRSFNGQPFEAWVAKLVEGDASTGCNPATPTAAQCPTVTEVEDFLDEVLPTGARYSIRLDNGVTNRSLPLLPLGSTQTAHGGRAAQVVFLPNWAAYSSATYVATITLTPGQVLKSTDAGYSLLDPTGPYNCYQAPTTASKAPSGATWESRWQAAPGAATPWKASADVLGSDKQVPLDLPLGKWQMRSTSCSSGSYTYVNVVRPECLTSVTGTCASPYFPYGLELVVWFGA